jgi:hypothetical protein
MNDMLPSHQLSRFVKVMEDFGNANPQYMTCTLC